MDNVLIVVDDLEAVKAFFIGLGLELEGEQTVEGLLVGKLIGLGDVRATLAMLRTPDGQGIELDKFHTPGRRSGSSRGLPIVNVPAGHQFRRMPAISRGSPGVVPEMEVGWALTVAQAARVRGRR